MCAGRAVTASLPSVAPAPVVSPTLLTWIAQVRVKLLVSATLVEREARFFPTARLGMRCYAVQTLGSTSWL